MPEWYLWKTSTLVFKRLIANTPLITHLMVVSVPLPPVSWVSSHSTLTLIDVNAAVANQPHNPTQQLHKPVLSVQHLLSDSIWTQGNGNSVNSSQTVHSGAPHPHPCLATKFLLMSGTCLVLKQSLQTVHISQSHVT